MKKVVCLKHKLDNNEILVGFFEAEKADEFFSFYNDYSKDRFGSNANQFDISLTTYTDEDYVYLLKICEKSKPSDVIEEKLFGSMREVEHYIEQYAIKHDRNSFDYEIGKYKIGEKYWNGQLLPSLY